MRNPRQDRSVVIGSVLVAMLVGGYFYFDARTGDPIPRISNSPYRVSPVPPKVDRSTYVPAPMEHDSALEQELMARTALDIRDISEELTELLEEKEFRIINDELLQVAARAVETGDQAKLGGVLSLLGQLSIEERDFDSAEVYLMEALDVYEEAGNTFGAAQVHMHLGRMHLKLRQRARTAGQVYDRTLLARWQLTHGRYDSAEQNLIFAIDENLSIDRFGAAASAYNSLVRLYTEVGDSYEAQRAAMQAARLYAASGQMDNAAATVAKLEQAGMEDWRLFDIEHEIERRYQEFRANVEQINRVQDYRRLYHHYRSQGDERRAWRLRLQASRSLRKVSKRAMYHRIPDVLALLYISNDDKVRARDYFDLAGETFDLEGHEDLWSQTQKLKGEIL